MVSWGGYRYGQEERGEGELPLGDALPPETRPAVYHEFDIGTSISKRFNRLWVQFGGAVSYIDVDSGALPSLSGLTRDLRTGTVVEGISKVSYEILPNTSIFVEGRVNERNYVDVVFDSTGQ